MNALLIIFITALVISAVGFIKYVYYFSVGYGLSIAGIGLMLIFIYYGHMPVGAALMALLFIIYGLRLGGYLLIREIKSLNYRKFLKDEIKSRISLKANLSIWISCAILYTCMCFPLLNRLELHKKTGRLASMDIFMILGILMAVAGALLEMAADMQKTKAKAVNPHRFVDTGLYRIVRCPNYFGEVLLWTGVFLSGIPSYKTVLQWIIALLGYLGILYVMFSGTRRLEIRQDKNYGEDPEYQAYVSSTPILIPFIPLYSVKKYTWLVA